MQTNILENLIQTTQKYPDKTAVIDETSTITYTELWEAARHTGNALSASLSGEFQQPVLIFIDKSIDCLKAMMGVLYSGNYYVVMDITTPIDRFGQIVSILEDPVLITTRANREKLEQLAYAGRVFLIDELEKEGEKEPDRAGWKGRIDTDLVYVLFTSGSTGIPKGVAVTQHGLVDYVDAYVAAIPIDETDVLGNQSPFFFDVSLRDIYMAQKTGATLCIVPTRFFTTPKKLLNFLEEKQVTSLAWVSTAYRLVAMFNGLQKIRPSKLQKFVFCGEAMPTHVYNYWKKEYPEGLFYQQYGLTEITGACSYYEIKREFRDEETIPIGTAFTNTELFLIDDEGEYIPPSSSGRVGEIYIRGSGVAPGYFNDPEKTEELFVQNPLQDHYPEKVYRSGDLAYWNDRQELIFVSRKDFQIKHSGHRIELGEIENGILSVDGVESCCCVQNRQEDVIVCFYVGAGVTQKDIMIHAQKKLPRYMLPSVYECVEELPTLPNGKIDRKTLDHEVNNKKMQEDP